MPCDEWSQLVEHYRGAVRAYHEAATALSVPRGTGFTEAWWRTERARAKCDLCRADLLQHEHRHACLDMDQSGGRLAMEMVRLFNVTTEHWETVQTAVHGHPPNEALAYQPSEAPESARWIVDRRDFTEKRHAGVALRYTETGLNILREEGFEM